MDNTTGLTLTAVNRNHTNSNCSRDNLLKTVVFPVLYSLLFLFGLSINGLAVWVFFSIPSRSHFIIYLKNIVVADVFMTLTFPVKVLSDSNMASLGLRVFVCRVSSVIFYMTMKLLSGAIWGSMLALSLPNVILTSHKPISPYFKCSDLKTATGVLWHEVVNHVCQFIFWGNLVTVIVCYSLITKELYSSYASSKASSAGGVKYRDGKHGPGKPRRISANVFLVLAVFFLCFVPFHFARVPYTMSQTRARIFDCNLKLFLFQLKESTLWLSSLNSLLDPLIYFFLCKSFRTTLFKTLRLPPGSCSWLAGMGAEHNTNSTPLEDSTP
ncbi:hypothetical protein DPEC_G00244340 [Dallia pectoralis]|uniref:Uncharacterized protein n=1 Tax=Dallia pectoralis TaxID=75939 RepID=A0ACC2FVZ2_DALPE|nr:hypothetical protein DPEC_G00244340 [Dallia pectoralis]